MTPFLTINRNILPRHRLSSFCLCSVLALFLSPAGRGEINIPPLPHKKAKEIEPLPPQAIPVKVEVEPGGTLQIPLRVYGKRGRTVRYLVRREPTLGKIVSIKQADQEIWILTYQQTAPMTGGGDLHDQIVFAAQDEDGTSAPAEIAITVADAPAAITAPDRLDFGEVAAGTAVSRTLTIANKGGQVVEGAFEIQAPWKVEPERYRLGRGEEATFKVTLLPRAEQEFRGWLRLPDRPGKITVLQAVAVAPVGVKPLSLDLAGNPDTLGRAGEITLTNRTAGEQTVRLQGDPRLHLPAEVVLPPQESKTLPVTLGEGDLAALETAIEVRYGEAVQPVQVHAPAVGARLRASKEKADFGKVEVGHARKMEITLENRGGSTASVAISAPSPFEIKPARFELEAGKRIVLAVTLDPAWPGAVSGTAKIQTAGSSIVLPLAAQVAPRTISTLKPASPPKPGTAAAPALAAPGGANPVNPGQMAKTEAEQPAADPSVPSVAQMELVRFTRTSAELAWNRPGKDDLDYRVEGRSLRLDPNGILQIRWVPMPGVTIKKEKAGERVTARVSGIPAGASVALQVVAVTSDGSISKPSAPLFLTMYPQRVLLTYQRLFVAFFGALLAGALWLRAGRSIFGVRLWR